MTFEEAREEWFKEACDLSAARERYTVARAQAVLDADGKTAEKREAQARLATTEQRFAVSHAEVREQAARWTVEHLLRAAREKAA